MAHSSTSFRPGQSGNPRGRPRGAWGWKRRIVAMVTTDPQPVVSPQIGEALIRRALAGELRAVRAILDALEYGNDPGDDW
jgi:hypothetical protein